MKQYKVKRTATCPFPVVFLEHNYIDINIAHSICENYRTFFCAGQCGCQFEVEEIEMLTNSIYPQPLTMDYIYAVPSYITSTPITVNLPSDPGQWTISNQSIPTTTNATLTFNNDTKTWIITPTPNNNSK